MLMNMTAIAFAQPIDIMFAIYFLYYAKTMLIPYVIRNHTNNAKIWFYLYYYI